MANYYRLCASAVKPMYYLVISKRPKFRLPRNLVPCGPVYQGKRREVSEFLPDCKVIRV